MRGVEDGFSFKWQEVTAEPAYEQEGHAVQARLSLSALRSHKGARRLHSSPGICTQMGRESSNSH